MTHRTLAAVALLTVGALFAACGGEDGNGGSTGSGGGGTIPWGSSADASEADRTVEVDAADFEFDPDEIAVEPGETITFVVTNTGKAPHELTIGDFAFHQQHAEGQMAGHSHADTGTTGQIEPGDEGSFTWTFAEDLSELIYGCHVQGHFAMGMRGRLAVK